MFRCFLAKELRSDELVSPTPVKPPPNKSGMTTVLDEALAAFLRWLDAKELKERDEHFHNDSRQKLKAANPKKRPTSTKNCSRVPEWGLYSMKGSVAPRTGREFETCPF